ncbi:MAG TPA: PadR family transcriptional regulator [Bryobacteraceae bacterium]|jgi:PadR family transcriptional regulator, regulatory protein PadR|nr:PadR family transcriptional regulator [Bryobacteraceae bacterium]
MSDSSRTDLLQGTLDLLILKVLVPGPMHGYAISQRIQQVSRDILQVQQGSLYPALHRLERRKWVKAEWAASENNRRAKYYRLTAAGHRQLEEELSNWERITSAVSLILENT